MSAFGADWLALREPADAAARSIEVTRVVADALRSRREISVLDLGAGTGSNVRFLVDHLPGAQRWLLVDHDHDLLAAVPREMERWASAHACAITPGADEIIIAGARADCRVKTRLVDLHVDVDDERLYRDRDLVTASALLDLVSDAWLRTLATHCAQHRACVLFALTYDGRIECSPLEPEDEIVRELVNRHQRTDKGFGVALGPDAASAAEACFRRAGYEVRSERSDWMISPQSAELQRQLIEGWAGAAASVDPASAAMLRGWRDHRLAHVRDGRSSLLVGHRDLAACPSEMSIESRHP